MKTHVFGVLALLTADKARFDVAAELRMVFHQRVDRASAEVDVDAALDRRMRGASR